MTTICILCYIYFFNSVVYLTTTGRIDCVCVCVCVCAHAWERESACVVTAWSMRMPCWKTYAESNNICLKPLRLFTCTLTPSVLVPLLALMQTHQVNQKCFVFIGLLRWQADYQPDSSTCQRCMKILYWQSPMLPIMRDSDSCWANDGPYTHPNTPYKHWRNNTIHMH